MKNLKITFNLESPAILQNRFMTIDSILLNVFFQKYKEQNNINDFIKIEDFLDEIGKFIEIKNNVISGYIWYVGKNNRIYSDEYRMFKSMRHEEYTKQEFFTDKNFITDKGWYKSYDLKYPLLALPSIYFYITGDKDKIEELLKDIKYLGKKRKIGFGFTEEYSIEEIAENKGIFIDDTTVSKPVPCSQFSVNTHRVMFYRAYPPYWLKENKVACYMPPMYYTEEKDVSWNENYKSIAPADYISPTEFVYQNMQDIFNFTYQKKHFTPKNPLKQHTCIMCGGNNGIKRNYKEKNEIFPKTFTDFGFVDAGDYICDYCKLIENSDNLNKTANLFFSENERIYIGGGNLNKIVEKNNPYTKDMTKKAYENMIKNKIKETKLEFYKNIKEKTPPFLISIKNDSNSAHLIFKSTVNISNAIFQIVNKRYGAMTIDTEMFLKAIEELDISEDKKDCLYSKSKYINFKTKYTNDILNLLKIIYPLEEELNAK